MLNQSKTAFALVVVASLLAPIHRPAQADGGAVIGAVVVGGVVWIIDKVIDAQRRKRREEWWEDAFAVVTRRGLIYTGISLERAERIKKNWGGFAVGPGLGIASAQNTGLHAWVFGTERFPAVGTNESRARMNALLECKSRTFLAGCRVFDSGQSKLGKPPV